MYELVKINENDYYVNSPSKVGLVKISDTEVVLIDSGNDKNAGKKIKKAIDENGWTLKAIYVTHSHADHIGGAKYLSEAYCTEVYAKGIERDFTEHTELEGAFLYGAQAPSELKHKFLFADPSEAEPLLENTLPSGLTMISLGGHSFDMVGFMTKDKTFYIADSISSRETLDKYKIGYIYDVGKYIETLTLLKGINADLYVPAHAEASDNISELIDYNLKAVVDVCEKIEEIVTAPRTFEEILKELFDTYGLTMSFEQYALVGSTLRSYLTYLKGSRRIESKIEDNRLLWIKK